MRVVLIDGLDIPVDEALVSGEPQGPVRVAIFGLQPLVEVEGSLLARLQEAELFRVETAIRAETVSLKSSGTIGNPSAPSNSNAFKLPAVKLASEVHSPVGLKE
jgi:hypothetical protein